MQIYCFGELLVDLLAREQGKPLAQVGSFDRAPGGAPANVAADLALLGLPVAFMGLLGDDPFADFLSEFLDEAGVSTDMLVRSPRVGTPMAFIATQEDGSQQICFSGLSAWASALAGRAEMDAAVEPGHDRWLHVGGVASAWPELHARQRALLTRAKRAGWRTSLDVNYRASLWDSPGGLFATRISELLPLVDVVKVAVYELDETLRGRDTQPADALGSLLAFGPSVAVVTRGERGALVRSRAGQLLDLDAVDVDLSEPTGAGDAFMAGLIAGLSRAAGKPGASWPAAHDLEFAASLANECGALAVTRAGAPLNLRRPAVKTYPTIAQWMKQLKST